MPVLVSKNKKNKKNKKKTSSGRLNKVSKKKVEVGDRTAVQQLGERPAGCNATQGRHLALH
jgi:hypothetical protein